MKASVHEFLWPAAPDRPHLEPGAVHVWSASLNRPEAESIQLHRTLAEDERQRAERFRFDLHRNRYIAGRGLLRTILARYLDCPAEAIAFQYSDHGKPRLANAPEQPPLHFNLGHSGDVALVAVTRLGIVGVDVEEVRAVREVDDLVERFFSTRESELFRRLPTEEKSAAFFNLWTRKEALLKATGEGISGGLNRVEVAFSRGEPARLLAMPGDPDEAQRWNLSTLEPCSNVIGAVAVRSKAASWRCWHWG